MTPTGPTVSDPLQLCAQEPIHIPGSIQPHGFLLALDSNARVAQASANAAGILGIPPDRLFGARLADLRCMAPLENVPSLELDSRPELLLSISAPDGATYQAIAHRHDGITLLEFERMPDFLTVPPSANTLSLVRGFMRDLAMSKSIGELNSAAAREIRRLTDFDRVLIYRFDAEWNGTVVSENRNEELPSYLDLRFPASDIPAQARDLYRKNRLRIIPDAGYAAVPIEPTVHPETGRPLDLSYSVLRSVSPVHVQYMKNMGTGASMSISILRDGELWGLVSCHNKEPRRVSFEVRAACDMIAQLLSSQLAAVEHRVDAESRIELKSTQTRLLAYMAEEENFLEGLSSHPEELMACAGAAGAAIVFDRQCRSFGIAPDEAQIRELATWLRNREGGGAIFVTDSLGSIFAPAKKFSDVACGVIAASISSLHDSFLLWFRPEVIQTVKWGGNPGKSTEPGTEGRLNPRNSFEIWKEQVRGRSLPWSSSQIDSAADLRESIVRIVLRKAEELAELSGQLMRSNQELESFSYSVSHDLRAPFRHIVGFAELLRERESANLSDTSRRYIATIIESAHFAGTLVDNLLNFSQIGRASLRYTDVDTGKLVAEVKNAEMRDLVGRSVEWKIGPLPRVRGDLFMLRLVFQNLISNALKYSRTREKAIIEISAAPGPSDGAHGEEIVFTVRDNGVGFDPQYSGKLFGIFQRLHKMEDFEGTGIGLANVRRIITRHGGRTWADGAVDQGAAFSFSLPAAMEANNQQ